MVLGAAPSVGGTAIHAWVVEWCAGGLGLAWGDCGRVTVRGGVES